MKIQCIYKKIFDLKLLRLRPYLMTINKNEICPYMKMIEEEI